MCRVSKGLTCRVPASACLVLCISLPLILSGGRKERKAGRLVPTLFPVWERSSRK